MKKLTRRTMLKLSGTAAAGALLAACTPAPAAPPAAETAVDAATAAPANPPTNTPQPIPPTRTPAPTLTQPPTKAYRRPEIIKFHPDAKSQVVRVHGQNVWNGDALDAAVIRKMVDTALTTLTGLADAKAAWQALFLPTEKIAIKVNAFRNSTIWTHTQLVYAVTDSMQEAGLPGDNITIFDFYTDELKTAGFTINKDSAGLKCYGTDRAYATSYNVGTREYEFSDILTAADALINMPILKSHMMAGTTFALKNHYGSVSFPDGLHAIEKSLPALNVVPVIKDATRLVIGDILSANTKYGYSWPYWAEDARGDSILMSYDPLAHDTIGYGILLKLAEEKGNPTEGIKGMTDPWLQTCADAGLGTSDLNNINLVEL